MQNIAHKASSRPLTTAPTRRSIKSSDCWQPLDRHTADINVKVVLSKNREVRIYRAGIAIAERLAMADPSNARRQIELLEMYDTVGAVLKTQGNQPEAVKSYSASLAIAERLTKTDPGNAGRQRDLAVRYSGIGDMLKALGKLPE